MVQKSGELQIIGGSASEALTIKVARELGVQALKTEIRRFPDGETYVRCLDKVDAEKAAVIQSVYLHPNDYLIEYFLIVDMLKDLGVKTVYGVLPYFAYARQDERFTSGEAVSFATVTKLIEKAGTDQVFTIDAHRHRVPDITMAFKIPAVDLTAMGLLAQYAQQKYSLENPLVVGPDEEAERWAREAAEQLRCGYDILEKIRLSDTEVSIKPKRMDVRGHDVLIVDDIISTGGTMAETCTALLNMGARRVLVACTHPLLVGNALARVLRAGAEDVIGTDTVPSPVSYVTVAPVISKAIREINLSLEQRPH